MEPFVSKKIAPSSVARIALAALVARLRLLPEHRGRLVKKAKGRSTRAGLGRDLASGSVFLVKVAPTANTRFFEGMMSTLL